MDIKSFTAKLRELLAAADEDSIEVFADVESGTGPRVFIPQAFKDVPDWIPFLPKPGTYEHRAYGKVEMSKERAERFIDGFNKQLYQQHIPIDAEHQTKVSGAMGYMREMRLNDDGSADARIEWTDRGKSLLEADRFRYFSPEIADTWVDNATGVTHRDVVIGGALTTKPFFKDSSLRSLAASEDTTATPKEGQMPDDNGDTSANQFAEVSRQFAEEKARGDRLEAEAKTFAEANLKLTETVEKLATAARTRTFAEEVEGRSAANNIRWFGDVPKHLSMLESLAKAFGEDSEQVKDYIDLNRSQAQAMNAALPTKEIGVAGVPLSGGVAEKTNDAINKYREAHPEASAEQAKTAVFSENPDLVRAMREGK